MPSSPLSTVVIVTWRGGAHLGACLDAVVAQSSPHQMVVVDNAADAETRRILASHPSRPAIIRLPENAGYAGGIAAALDSINTRFVAWLNDDAAPWPGWLAVLEAALAADEHAGAASARLRYPDGSLQSSGVGLSADGHGINLNGVTRSGDVFGFCGGAALVRTDALRAVGGVPGAFFCYYEDTDTSWRLRLAGLRILAVPDAEVVHAHGASTRPGSAAFHRWNERNRLLMLVRCAPAHVATRELARFAVITLLLPVRRALGRPVPDAANFRVGLRLRVLAEVAWRLPWALRTRRAIGAMATVSRDEVWQRWAGRMP